MEGKSLISQIGTVLGTIIGIVLILYLAYITTKLLGKRFSFKNSSHKLKILDNIAIGKEKQIMIVKAGTKTFLVGASSGSINLISELDSSEFPEEELQNEVAEMDFKTAFKKVLENNVGRKNTKEKVDSDDSSKTK